MNVECRKGKKSSSIDNNRLERGHKRYITKFGNLLVTLQTTPERFFYWFLRGIASGNGVISALPALATCETYSAGTDEKKYKSGKGQPKTCQTNAKEKSK